MADPRHKIRSRAYVFTLHNYTDDDVAYLSRIECQYIIYGYEVCPTTGTPHLQGYIYFFNPRRQFAVEKLRKWWVKPAGGDPQSNDDYTSKDAKFYERGTRPKSDKEKGMLEQHRWRDSRLAAAEGRFSDIPDDIMLRYSAGIRFVRQHHLSTRTLTTIDELDNEWCWGETGTGKSRLARQRFPDAYIKDASTKWWCGYSGQEVVIIDDWDLTHAKNVYHLKIWADHYPFPAETKGGNMVIRPKKIIVTSNYHPSEIWSSHQDINPILRRFKVIDFENGQVSEVSRFSDCALPKSKKSRSQDAEEEDGA